MVDVYQNSMKNWLIFNWVKHAFCLAFTSSDGETGSVAVLPRCYAPVSL